MRKKAAKKHFKATGRVAGYLEDKVLIAQGRTYVTNTSIAQYAAVRLHPSVLGDRAVGIADMYALWRPKSVRFRAISLGSGANVCIGHMYPNNAAAPVTTMEEFVDLPACKFGSGAFGSPLPDLLLEQEYWRSTDMPQWFSTTTISVEDMLEDAGFLIYGNGDSTMSTHYFRGVIEWEFEFKSMVDPQVSLARLRARSSQETKVEEGYIKVQESATTSAPSDTPPPLTMSTGVIISRNVEFAKSVRPYAPRLHSSCFRKM